jgi:23S rRNA pseudouridine2605 synthase
MRLQQFIAAAGVCSRRRAEELIRAGSVIVNGQPAVIGMAVDPVSDQVMLQGRVLKPVTEHTYIMLHKPRGVVTTMHDEKGRKTVAELTRDVGVRLYPVGRLDMDSEGLLLMTDDGDVANRMAHPSHGVEKTYRAWVEGEDIDAGAALLRTPLTDGTVRYRPARVRVLRRGKNEAELSIVISEGKNRQIRKMCALAGLRVTKLVRVSEGPLRLGGLPAGAWRCLSPEEILLLQGGFESSG